MGTKKARIYGKGAPLNGTAQRFGGGRCPKLPPLWIRQCFQLTFYCFALHMFACLLYGII